MPDPGCPPFTITSPEGRPITLQEANYHVHVTAGLLMPGQQIMLGANTFVDVVADKAILNPGRAVAMLIWERDFWKERAESLETKLADVASGEEEES